MKRILRAFAIGVPLVVIAGIAMLALARPGNNPGGGGGGPKTFEVSGSVGPVYPLVDAVLPLKVENPNRSEILVTELTIEVADATPECGAENLVITPVAVPFSVAARGETTVNTQARLVDDVADSCQGATFGLIYRGSAIQP
jgi:hypothetical protein